jgi:hypothetical protein
VSKNGRKVVTLNCYEVSYLLFVRKRSATGEETQQDSKKVEPSLLQDVGEVITQEFTFRRN